MSQAEHLLEGYTLPEKLGFGEVLAPVMYRADYQDGEWGEGGIVPYGDVLVSPASNPNHGLAASWRTSSCPFTAT